MRDGIYSKIIGTVASGKYYGKNIIVDFDSNKVCVGESDITDSITDINIGIDPHTGIWKINLELIE